VKKAFSILAAGSVASLVTATPALANKNDDAWAACLWDKVPTSANNWLNFPEPSKYQDLGAIKPEFALQNRLEAACRRAMVPAGKESAPRFSVRNVRAALIASKPSTVGQDTLDPRAYVCTRYFLSDKEMNNPAAYRWGFGEDTTQAQLGSMSLMFAAVGGGSVGLPDTGGLEKCEYVQADGTLKDA
jgi:hypothetical protein